MRGDNPILENKASGLLFKIERLNVASVTSIQRIDSFVSSRLYRVAAHQPDN